MRRVGLLTLGCKVSQYETEAIAESFERAGYTVSDFSEVNDVYVINTCTVTAEADRKSRQMIRRAKKKNPEAEIDYIHDESSLRALAEKEKSVGFLFDGMGKDELFKTVIFDGALPRKTFSMGHARDKRYYLECRKIK